MVVPGSIPNMMRSFDKSFVSGLKLQVQSFCYFALMISIPHKAKQFFLVTFKLLIVCGAFYYIYYHFQGDKKIPFDEVERFISIKSVLILFLFSSLNWIFEINKWKHLVSSFKEISFLKAMEQSLGSLTASIFTPNRIGEYGAKALYFAKENTKQIILLNFLGNSSQMFITTVFGLIGFSIVSFKFLVSGWIIFGVFLAVVLLLLLFKNIEIYGFSIKKLVNKISSYSLKFSSYLLWYSMMRYVVFSCQFLFLLLLFDIDIDIVTAFGTIFTMYFLASIIPTIHLMDVAIKGSVALYLFGQLGIEPWKIAAIVSIMWVFNLVIPVIIGSFFVLRFNPQQK